MVHDSIIEPALHGHVQSERSSGASFPLFLASSGCLPFEGFRFAPGVPCFCWSIDIDLRCCTHGLRSILCPPLCVSPGAGRWVACFCGHERSFDQRAISFTSTPPGAGLPAHTSILRDTFPVPIVLPLGHRHTYHPCSSRAPSSPDNMHRQSGLYSMRILLAAATYHERD